MSNLPWLAPAFIGSVAIAILVSRPLGRALGTSRSHAAALVASVGLILAATLTPLRPALTSGVLGSGRCDVDRLTPLPLEELLRLGDPLLNVLLFVPLGLCLALLPPTRRSATLWVAGAMLPVAIELTQLAIAPLDRACESGDVVDNLTGLALGLILGLGGRAILRARGRSGRR